MKVIGAVVLAALVLAACGRAAPWPPAKDRPADAVDSGYRPPPQLRAARRTADGGVALSGWAPPGASVRLASPDGQHRETTADNTGAWTLKAPAPGPALYGLSQEIGGARVQAEGYIAVLPGATPLVAELRAGAAAVSLADGRGRPALLAADTDRSGVTIVSGWAAPNQPLMVLVDGVLADEGTAGQDGRFALSLPKPLAPGVRDVAVVGGASEARASVEIRPSASFPGVLAAAPRGAGWRLDWMTPAGGVQTTQLFAPAEAAP